MRVEALIKRDPITVDPSTSIVEAARLIGKHKIGLLVVTSAKDSKRATGVVSERDIVRAVAEGLPLTQRVETIATKKLITVQRSDSLSKALKQILGHNIRHLVVENYDGTLYGVLSVRDLLRERNILEGLIQEEAKSSYETE